MHEIKVYGFIHVESQDFKSTVAQDRYDSIDRKNYRVNCSELQELDICGTCC